MADVLDQPIDQKPVEERKDEPVYSGVKASDWNARDANDAPKADESAIGSPDVFLTEKHRGDEFARTKVYQVWGDGAQRGYIVVDSTAQTPRVGYFELAEGMHKAEAEEALRGAYDNTAVLV